MHSFGVNALLSKTDDDGMVGHRFDLRDRLAEGVFSRLVRRQRHGGADLSETIAPSVYNIGGKDRSIGVDEHRFNFLGFHECSAQGAPYRCSVLCWINWRVRWGCRR